MFLEIGQEMSSYTSRQNRVGFFCSLTPLLFAIQNLDYYEVHLELTGNLLRSVVRKNKPTKPAH